MKKRVQQIKKTATIKCPHCSGSFRIKNSKECIYSIECRKCREKIDTPMMKCCLFCAYSNIQCTPSLLREALKKGLEVRGI